MQVRINNMHDINDIEIETEENNVVECPMCGTPVEMDRLALMGIDVTTLAEIRDWISKGTVDENVRAVKMMQRRTEESGRDLANQKAIHEEMEPVLEQIKRLSFQQDKLSRGVDEIHTTFVPRKGDIAEEINMQLFQSVFPQYKFEQKQAAQGTSDGICTVMKNGNPVGAITISIKNTAKWSNEYVTQVGKDMEVDGTDAAIIVVKKMPSKPRSNHILGVNHSMHLGKIVIAAVQGAPAVTAMASLSQYLIHIDENDRDLARSKEMLADDAKVMIDWLHGDKGKQVLTLYRIIVELSKDARKKMVLVKNYTIKNMDDGVKHLDKSIATAESTSKLFEDFHRMLNSNRSKEE